jgi:hypothetical protein
MKLFQVYNGEYGNSSLVVLVIAENKTEAEDMAREQYKKECQDYGRLEVKEICDTDKKYVSEVMES